MKTLKVEDPEAYLLRVHGGIGHWWVGKAEVRQKIEEALSWWGLEPGGDTAC